MKFILTLLLAVTLLPGAVSAQDDRAPELGTYACSE